MSRATGAQVEARIEKVCDLLLSRLEAGKVEAHCVATWRISARQARTYVARARRRIAATLTESREQQLAKALADYDLLFAKQLAAGRLADARRTLDSIVQLLGLVAPQRLEVYDYSTYSDEQLAAEVARELPELIEQARRLTGGAAPSGGGAGELTGELDPPRTDAAAG